MDDQEFLTIESELREVCARIGAPELTEDRFYGRRVSSEEPERLLPPKERVVAQIEALERYMSLYDRRIYDGAMYKIQSVLSQSIVPTRSEFPLPTGAAVIVSDRVGAGEDVFDLGELPDLEQLRLRLRSLANHLRES
jgi:hypothetical protein